MLNSRGELVRAIPDTCQNYNPIMDKPTEVRSEKLGVIYECRNHTMPPEMAHQKANACCWCLKRTDNDKGPFLLKSEVYTKAYMDKDMAKKGYTFYSNLTPDKHKELKAFFTQHNIDTISISAPPNSKNEKLYGYIALYVDSKSIGNLPEEDSLQAKIARSVLLKEPSTI